MEGFLEGATRGPAEQVGGGENIRAKEPKASVLSGQSSDARGTWGTANHPLRQT